MCRTAWKVAVYLQAMVDSLSMTGENPISSGEIR